jgi:hypothetical protein
VKRLYQVNLKKQGYVEQEPMSLYRQQPFILVAASCFTEALDTAQRRLAGTAYNVLGVTLVEGMEPELEPIL